MKGVILKCLKDLVVEKFGKNTWQQIFDKSGFNIATIIASGNDYEDEVVVNVIVKTCEVLNISLFQAADAFGDYWMNTFAPNVYGAHLMGAKTAREFLLKLNGIHDRITKSVTDAHPPRFELEWLDNNTLIFRYISKRGLVDFVVGLLKGVGKKFNEQLGVEKLNETDIKVIFNK